METMTGTHEQRTFKELTFGGSTSVMTGGAAAGVLAIVALAGVAPEYLVAVAAIALGVAMLLEGGFIASEYGKILNGGGESGRRAKIELGGGLSGEALAGVASIVLGVLALLGVVPAVLVSIAAIVLGAGQMFGSGITSRLNALKIDASSEHETAKQVASEAMTAATGLQLLVGLAAVVLGILALVGLEPLTLDLVAMLALGSSFLLSGGAIAGRVLSYFA